MTNTLTKAQELELSNLNIEFRRCITLKEERHVRQKKYQFYKRLMEEGCADKRVSSGFDYKGKVYNISVEDVYIGLYREFGKPVDDVYLVRF